MIEIQVQFPIFARGNGHRSLDVDARALIDQSEIVFAGGKANLEKRGGVVGVAIDENLGPGRGLQGQADIQSLCKRRKRVRDADIFGTGLQLYRCVRYRHESGPQTSDQ